MVSANSLHRRDVRSCHDCYRRDLTARPKLAEYRKLRNRGMSVRQIAERVDRHPNTVREVLNQRKKAK